MIWAQSLRGRAIDLVNPTPEQVDFREIADTLTGVYRWCGAAELDISVALHTLIVSDAAPEDIKPYALLHDAHEARTGDIPRPVQMALAEIAGHAYRGGNFMINGAIGIMKTRHDRAIYAAAGLEEPTPHQCQEIKLADNIALMTERRDFLLPPPRPWDAALEAIRPLRRRYRHIPKPDVAIELYRRFQQYLPALQQRGVAA